MTATQSLTYRETRTYVVSALFVLGNIVLPQLCHLMPRGGLVWLPIYFFTLVAAYRFGLTAGLVTAVLSPVINNLMFGMPSAAMIPVILTKSVLLALAAALTARRVGDVRLPAVVFAVCVAQLTGSLAEWGMTGSLEAAVQDVTLGLPGILLQMFGGYMVCRMIRQA